jgi:putative radical SAM enzyme (TIGR03279 family)
MPTINDGEFLSSTFKDLYNYYPQLKSCTIVPVGLTEHRKGLMEIPTVTGDYAKRLVQNLTEFQELFPGKSSPFVLLSDEWYILADEVFPPLSVYGDVDLTENGVGQVQAFLTQFEKEAAQFPSTLPCETNVSLAVGTLIYETFQHKVIPVLNRIDNLNITLYPIINNFFGESVTVTGLLTGKDIISQLSSESLGDVLWMSHRILNDDQTKTLDDLTLADISKGVDCPIYVSNDSFLELINKLNHG